MASGSVETRIRTQSGNGEQFAVDADGLYGTGESVISVTADGQHVQDLKLESGINRPISHPRPAHLNNELFCARENSETRWQELRWRD